MPAYDKHSDLKVFFALKAGFSKLVLQFKLLDSMQ